MNGHKGDIVDLIRSGEPVMVSQPRSWWDEIIREGRIRDAVEQSNHIDEMRRRIRNRDVYGTK